MAELCYSCYEGNHQCDHEACECDRPGCGYDVNGEEDDDGGS